jgi:hypothetical protein
MQTADNFIRDALECSIYIAPRDHGLANDELFEAARRAGIGDGAMGDALRSFECGERRGTRLVYHDQDGPLGEFFIRRLEPDYRNIQAFDFVARELRTLANELGRDKARLTRDVLVANGVAAGLREQDVEVAISIWLATEMLEEKAGVISSMSGWPPAPPGEQGDHPGHVERRDGIEKVYSIVKDIIERRTDGRRPAAEPIRAFESALNELGYARFRSWWIQTANELSRTDPALSPMSACVLAGALVEGALVMIMKRARELGKMQSPTYAKSPHTWKLEDMIASATGGGIIDAKLKDAAERLVAMRNRIHVGSLLDDKSGLKPEARPEEAREAKQTLEGVLRSILVWLEANPAPKAS